MVDYKNLNEVTENPTPDIEVNAPDVPDTMGLHKILKENKKEEGSNPDEGKNFLSLEVPPVEGTEVIKETKEVVKEEK